MLEPDLELEPKTLDAWSQSWKFELWSHTGLPDENFNKMPNNAKKRPEKGQTDC